MRLHHQMTRWANEADRERYEFWVVKLLTHLSDKSLRTAAATCVTELRSLVIECNFVDKVWDDPRIKRRVDALGQQLISVERQENMLTVAGQSYNRQQLVVTF